MLVAYEIYRQVNRYGRPAGLLGRGESGIEIIIAVAYQVYCLGLSINNAAEQQLGDDALARKTGRASKTPAGAKRRSVISSVLQSIGKQVENFTLASVIKEANDWLAKGRSCFAAQITAGA